MLQSDFDREITRLRNHYGDRHYSSELVAILWKEYGKLNLKDFRAIILEAIATRPQGRPPLRDDFRTIASEIGINAPLMKTWQYFDLSDCMTCGGAGFYYVKLQNGGTGVVCCDECAAGKNMQIAPKPHINFTIKNVRGAVYDRPGKAAST